MLGGGQVTRDGAGGVHRASPLEMPRKDARELEWKPVGSGKPVAMGRLTQE